MIIKQIKASDSQKLNQKEFKKVNDSKLKNMNQSENADIEQLCASGEVLPKALPTPATFEQLDLLSSELVSLSPSFDVVSDKNLFVKPASPEAHEQLQNKSPKNLQDMDISAKKESNPFAFDKNQSAHFETESNGWSANPVYQGDLNQSQPQRHSFSDSQKLNQKEFEEVSDSELDNEQQKPLFDKLKSEYVQEINNVIKTHFQGGSQQDETDLKEIQPKLLEVKNAKNMTELNSAVNKLKEYAVANIKQDNNIIKQPSTPKISKWNILLGVVTRGLATPVQGMASAFGKDLCIKSKNSKENEQVITAENTRNTTIGKFSELKAKLNLYKEQARTEEPQTKPKQIE